MNYEQQLSFKFFWPLTEQIPLELDYTECVKYKQLTTYPLLAEGAYSTGTGVSGFPLAPTTINFTVSNNYVGYMSNGMINIGVQKKPNFGERLVYKLLGFNWKKK